MATEFQAEITAINACAQEIGKPGALNVPESIQIRFKTVKTCVDTGIVIADDLPDKKRVRDKLIGSELTCCLSQQTAKGECNGSIRCNTLEQTSWHGADLNVYGR